ncbi:GNAT family N-acetyltransferase [Paenisporosarcina cavernae]|uniref:N-acetyltransferase n=1 Tax=Paenisporosarcina cavernae TaxID=2320858 RepID=A0A385YPJ9_9BACL|nr:GNAT family N-acetyltransferase [Paenisporosarcina cavernae]AYC28526.1 N-acetyltransferase [Paenisporosarcina cavernae]
MHEMIRDIQEELHTERLYLRKPKQGDGTKANEAILHSLQELKPWLPFVQETPSVEDTEQNMRQAMANFLKRSALRYLIFEKDTHDFIGTTGFHNIDWKVKKLEIGYWIDSRQSGKGYMVEAIDRLTRFALDDLGMKRVEIRIESSNIKSRAIPEKLGYVLEGILVNDDLSVDGKTLTDTCVYAKTVR